MKTTKVLAIGNSFSEDATYYLKKIAGSADTGVMVVNLYIGGCSLETHAENIKANLRAYRYELNGVYTDRQASVPEILAEEKWDIVTLQQVSDLAGVYESYGESLAVVLDCIKTCAPQAKIYFHETWAYETDSTHPGFCRFHNNQEEMASAIENVVRRICRENDGLPVIPSGEIIREVRRTPTFDYGNGGRSLCRDGFHMDLLYGRYLLGLIWFKTLFGGNVEDVGFVPTIEDIVNGYVIENFQLDETVLNQLKAFVSNYKI